MDKKQRNYGFLKGKTKAKKRNRKKRNSLGQAFVGTKIDKESLKMQENNHFGLFCTKLKHRNTEKKKQNHQNQKDDKKKHLFAFPQTTPYFLLNFCFFYQVALSHVCKAVLC